MLIDVDDWQSFDYNTFVQCFVSAIECVIMIVHDIDICSLDMNDILEAVK